CKRGFRSPNRLSERLLNPNPTDEAGGPQPEGGPMDTTNSAFRCHLLAHLPALLAQPDVATRLRFRMPSLLALILVDLEPARPLLEPTYCPHTGRPHRDPVAMLRALLLMLMLGLTSINQWARRLKGEPELRALCGFDPQARPPGVGTLYDFVDRLLDGPHQHRCEHVQRPSDRYRQKRNRFRRQLKQEKEARKTQAEQAQANEGRVQHLVQQVLGRKGQDLPHDFTQRLNEILFVCAVLPSAQMGLVGQPHKLMLAGDGTAIESQADGWGHALCTCQKQGLSPCQCPRLYSDPDATWGYDSHRERYFFGYRLHLLIARWRVHDLPLSVSLQGAHTPDVVMAIEDLFRLYQRLLCTDIRIAIGLWDKGYDATGFYLLHAELGIIPVIPLSNQSRTPRCQHEVPRNDQGVPLCPAGLPMRLHGYNKNTKKVVYNCPVKRPGRTGGKLVFKVHPKECPRGSLCEPQTVMGPLVHIGIKEDPRMNLPI